MSEAGDDTQERLIQSADERIFGLLALAEDQQTAVRAGVEGMALERAAMAKERVALVQQTEAMKKLADELTKTVLKALPQMAQASAMAAKAAVEKALAGAAETSTQAATLAAKPTLASLSGAVQSANAVQLALKKAVKDFARKWTWVAASATAGAILAAALVSWGLVWWQRQELQSLAAERDKLSAEVNALQGQADQTRRNGARRPAK